MRLQVLLLCFARFAFSVDSDIDEEIPFDFSQFDAFPSENSASSEENMPARPMAAPSFNISRQLADSAPPSLPVESCESTGVATTFLRIPEVYVMGVPSFVSKIELVTCAKHCREDVEPLSGERRPCRGFNFQNNNDAPSCEYFDLNAKTGMLNWNAGLRSYYFEKVCLLLNEECRERAFAFEKRRNLRFAHTGAFYSSAVSSEEDCLDVCLRQSNCYSLNFDKTSKTCELFNVSHRSNPQNLVESAQFDYFENNCVHEKDRCPGKRLEFIATKKTEIRGRDVAVGVKSIRNCMRECVESTHFLCRSFEFDAESNECFIVDEQGGDQAVFSANLDLYEPFCTSVDLPCSRPYVFEKIKHRNLIAPNSISDHLGVDLNSCLEMCLVHPTCRSLTYTANTRKCRLLALNRTDAMTRSVTDLNVDFYELGCAREGVLLGNATRESTPKKVINTTALKAQIPTRSTCTPNESQIVEPGRTLRQEYRNVHHINVKDLKQCETLCAMASIRCRTIAFGAEKHDCFLSSASFDSPSQIEQITQPNDQFNVYRFVQRNCDVSGPTAPSTVLPKPFTFSSVTPRSTFEPTVSPRVTARRLSSPTRSQAPTTNAPFSTTHVDFATQRMHDERRLIPQKSDGVARAIPAQNVQVTVECLPRGMNVSFHVTGAQARYSGALYAAERFSTCSVLVEDKERFSIFLPNPALNSSCNVVDFNSTLTSVIVMSNDLVTPLDITTKEDLFYQILCDYSTPQISQPHYGLVVGGPDPKTVASSAEGAASKVNLKILKGDAPVENVFLGEKLTAVLESDVDASKLRVVDCNASRIGGMDSQRKSVKLISEGCSVMPQVIGDIRRNQNRLEATLAAFRIDGSDQIDIVCNVMVCRETCPKQGPCTRKRRQVIETAEGFATIPSDSEVRTVDQRLRVFVQRDPSVGGQAPRRDFCFSAWMYFSTVGLLLVSLGTLFMFVCISFRKKRWNNSHCNYNITLPHGTSTDEGLPIPTSIPRVNCLST